MKKALASLCALLGCTLGSWAQLQLDAGQSYSYQFTPQMFSLGFSGNPTPFSAVLLNFSGFDLADSLRLEVSHSSPEQTLSTTAVEPGRNIFFGSFYIGDGAMRLEVLSGSITLETFSAIWNAPGPAPDINYMGSTGVIPVPEPHPILFLSLITLAFLGYHLRRRPPRLQS
jgi:hypothetical protein